MSQGSSIGWSQRGLGQCGLPLVPCPRCGDRIIELTSRSRNNPGKVFYKCQRNQQDIPGRCCFYMCREEYAEMISKKGADSSNLEHAASDVKEVWRRIEGCCAAIDRKMSKLVLY